MKIEHAALWTNDLNGTRDFFVKYFNAKSGDLYCNQKNRFKSYFLSFDSGSRLEIMQMEGVETLINQDLRTGFVHLAFCVGSKEGVDEMTQRLRSDGYTIASEPRTTGDGYYESVVLTDEGFRIEITA